MIIARSPLRISLGGGGTDLPSYYEKFGGFLMMLLVHAHQPGQVQHTRIFQRQQGNQRPVGRAGIAHPKGLTRGSEGLQKGRICLCGRHGGTL